MNNSDNRTKTVELASFYTIEEVAQMLKCEANVIYRHVKDGTMPAFNIAGPNSKRATWRISADDLQTFLHSCSNQNDQPIDAPKPRRRRKPDYKQYV